MIVVVSDTSPIRALHHLDLLALLPAQFDRILVPPAVLNELARPSSQFPSVPPDAIPFVEVVAPLNQQLVKELLLSVHLAEAEAIALAVEIEGAGILIDEADGRSKADKLGLRVIGTYRVLLDAKEAGFVPEVMPLVQRLVDELNFFTSPILVDRIRLLANET